MSQPAPPQRPLKVAVRPVFRPYLGGDLVRRFRRLPSLGDDHWTEEWIGSVTVAGNPDPAGQVQGLTVVVDQRGQEVSLKDLVESHPEAMLGSAFVERHGAAPGFLVKIDLSRATWACAYASHGGVRAAPPRYRPWSGGGLDPP